jgi:hypothetical protein
LATLPGYAGRAQGLAPVSCSPPHAIASSCSKLDRGRNEPATSCGLPVSRFAPDKGESVNTLIADPPPGAPVPPILPPADGFLFLDRDKFAGSFAADLSPSDAAFMADSQVPWGLDALNGAVSEPAWRAEPSWYLVATEDRMIPPPAQRAMSERISATTAEVAASHAVYVSQPDAVVDVISKAVDSVTAPSR